MALIEQAIYTLVRPSDPTPGQKTEKPNRYGVIAASPNVDLADIEAIADWSPRAEDMLDTSSAGVSFNFYPLPSGSYCISRSTMHGWEYGTGSPHFAYTQCLIVPRSKFVSFANDPFAVLRAAIAGGIFEIQHHTSQELEPLRLSGESPPVDATLLNRLRENPGIDWLTSMVQAALDSQRLVLYPIDAARHLLAGLLQCVPVECRPEFSFSTGLRDTLNRPFRIIVDDKLSGQHPAISNPTESPDTEVPHWRVAELNLSASTPPSEFAPLDGWPHFIETILKSNRLGFLSTQLAKRRFGLTTDDLPALALQLMENLDSSTMLFESDETWDFVPQPKKPLPPVPSDWLDGLQRAHAAHRQFQGSMALTLASSEPVAAPVSSEDPIIQEKIEQMDELVFEVVGGNLQLLGELRTVWARLNRELPAEILEKCREHYLRRSLQFWQQASETGEPIRDTRHAMLALDVLCLLFDGS
ncbi:MAG: hypothetical protein PVH19_04650 [Planctomycetia bacterium]|jgi:hypothetical protein